MICPINIDNWFMIWYGAAWLKKKDFIGCIDLMRNGKNSWKWKNGKHMNKIANNERVKLKIHIWYSKIHWNCWHIGEKS
jgi:hypothetical protein